MSTHNILVSLRDFSISYQTRLGSVSAVDRVNFDIYKGEILGLVGESGCGKSTLGKGIMRLIPPPATLTGQILFNGKDVMKFSDPRLRNFRGRQVSMIFQDPLTSLNPVQRVDEHLLEAIEVHEKHAIRGKVLERIGTLIERLGIQKSRMSSYPHQLSGGMRQRVMIGLGLVLNASLIIADEATTSLDVIVEAKLVDQLREIRDEFGVTILLITHNIALVAEIADRLAVMYAGRMAEIGPIIEVFNKPLHPYTQGLLKSIPSIDLNEHEELYKMPGEPPNLTHPPDGCRFHPRCPFAIKICHQIQPSLLNATPDQLVECWLYQKHPEIADPFHEGKV
jgi:peptide/nickel transport system ATP-binding protein